MRQSVRLSLGAGAFRLRSRGNRQVTAFLAIAAPVLFASAAAVSAAVILPGLARAVEVLWPGKGA